jgi:hypothetical protein
MIAEAKDFESVCRDGSRTRRVCPLSLIRKILTAIEFNDEPCGVADKVCDVAFNRSLAAEACTAQAMIASLGPENPLCIG